ncbi:MAG: transposase, partial [Deltaproteobacteria bacterium]
MYVRKKKNPSGIISVQIIDKSDGKYRLLKTIGSSSDTHRIDELYLQGKKWISNHLGEQDIFEQATMQADEKQITDFLLSKVENILINGTQLILDRVFKSVGFDKLNNDILKHLVIARLSQP